MSDARDADHHDGTADQAVRVGSPDAGHPHHHPIRGRSERWWVLLAVSLPCLVLGFDVAATTVSLPAIGDEMVGSLAAIGLVVLAFVLPFTGLGDEIRRAGPTASTRGLAIAGTLLYALGSAAGGASQDIWSFALARGVAGVGAALAAATGSTLLDAAFGDDALLAHWLRGAATAVGLTLGAVLGGALVDQVTWRFSAFVVLPLLVVSGWLISVVVPRGARPLAPSPPAEPAAPADLGRAGLLTAAVGLVAGGPLVIAPVRPATAAGVLAVAGGAACGVAWVRRIDRSSTRTSRAAGSGAASAALAAAGSGAAVVATAALLMSFVVQFALAESAVAAGAAVVALVVAGSLGASLSPWLTDVVGARVLLASSLVVVAVGAGVLATVDGGTSVVHVAVGLAILGVGAGAALDAQQAAFLGSTPVPGSSPVGLAAARAVGISLAIGIALPLLSVVSAADLGSSLSDAGASLSAAQQREVDLLLPAAPRTLSTVKAVAPEAVREVNDASRAALAAGAGAAMAAAALAALGAAGFVARRRGVIAAPVASGGGPT